MNSPRQFIRWLTACILIGCGGFAAAAPDRIFPKPEDPVVLPTEAEIAEQIRNIREAWLRVLKWDADGWDDLWVMIQMSHDRNYQFDPNDRQKDTDGDGMGDYEEMLVHRSATYKEPVYTREQQIARIREERLSGSTLLRVTLETGRRNQIRVQMAGAGHPLVGDRTYGTPSPLITRVALHAARLGFLHPRTLRQVRVETPLPDDMRRLLRRLRG